MFVCVTFCATYNLLVSLIGVKLGGVLMIGQIHKTWFSFVGRLVPAGRLLFCCCPIFHFAKSRWLHFEMGEGNFSAVFKFQEVLPMLDRGAQICGAQIWHWLAIFRRSVVQYCIALKYSLEYFCMYAPFNTFFTTFSAREHSKFLVVYSQQLFVAASVVLELLCKCTFMSVSV